MESQLETGHSQDQSQEALRVPAEAHHSAELPQQSLVSQDAVVEVAVLEQQVLLEREVLGTNPVSPREQSVKNLNNVKHHQLVVQLFQEETVKR
jgi:hypothetical protein